MTNPSDISSSERRNAPRCEICQGPTKQQTDHTWKCRNSLCISNHTSQKCPRCASLNLREVARKDAGFKYTCDDCENHWCI